MFNLSLCALPKVKLPYLVLPLPFLILLSIRKRIERRWGRCTNDVKLDGQIVIVTGANSGMGFEVARDLVRRNATVIFACRTLEKAQHAIDRIPLKHRGKGDLIPKELDLASLQSIQKFVEYFKSHFRKLCILVNNAAVSYPRGTRIDTAHNVEIHFAVNYLGPFYLTYLLLDEIKYVGGRVIFVSSQINEHGVINETLDNERHDPGNFHANSKLASVYNACELIARFQDKFMLFIACPGGWVYTNLFRHYTRWYHYVLLAPFAFLFMKTANQGAQTIIHCATDQYVPPWAFYKNCRGYESELVPKMDAEVTIDFYNDTVDYIEKVLLKRRLKPE